MRRLLARLFGVKHIDEGWDYKVVMYEWRGQHHIWAIYDIENDEE